MLRGFNENTRRNDQTPFLPLPQYTHLLLDMENENEPLDWGNEEEEQQHTHRRASHDYTARQELDADADEAGEDAISLGDEDEDGYYFQREDAQRQELSVAEAEESFEKPQSPRRQDDSLGANEQRRNEQPRYHDDRGRYERSPPPRSSNVQPDSPPREQPSRPQTSPGQIATTRLKHALPPKPASAKVPYLPPSHPSIVAATSMTEMPSRDTPHDAKPNGAGSAKPAAGATPLPHPWELRTPRGGGQLYYYNPETHASTWIHPVSNVSIYTPPQYRHHAGSRSPTEAYVTPSDPNMHQARGQASRPHADRDIPRGRSDRDIDNAARTDDSDRRDMSYRDRHYRPSGDPAAETAPVVHEARPAVRSDAMSGQYSARSRYDRSPPPASPPRQRRHARSVSPSDTRTLPVHPRSQEYPPPRGSHPGPRDRHGYTNAAPVIQRDTDITPRDRWAPSHIPPTEYERSDRVPHKPAHRPGNADERGYAQFSQDEPRPHIQRRESSRGPPRDRDNSRHPDVHEYPSGNSGFISAPSTLSASYHLPSLCTRYVFSPILRPVEGHDWIRISLTPMCQFTPPKMLSAAPLRSVTDYCRSWHFLHGLAFFVLSFLFRSYNCCIPHSHSVSHLLPFPELQDYSRANGMAAAIIRRSEIRAPHLDNPMPTARTGRPPLIARQARTVRRPT